MDFEKVTLAARLALRGWKGDRAARTAEKLIEARRLGNIEGLLESLYSSEDVLIEKASEAFRQIGDPAAIRPLLDRLESRRSIPHDELSDVLRRAVTGIVEQIAEKPRREHLPVLLDVLRWRNRYELEGRIAAEAILRLAERAPFDALRDALPLIGDYPDIRRRLEALLAPHAILPIPAERPLSDEELPIPASEAPVDPTNLPAPALPEPQITRTRWWKRR